MDAFKGHVLLRLVACILAGLVIVYLCIYIRTEMWEKSRMELRPWFTILSHIMASKPIIALCVCTRSLPGWSGVMDASLHTINIPSLIRTVTREELDKYQIRLYLGINDNDHFWREHVGELNATTWLSIHPGYYHMPKNRLPYNEVAGAAYNDGADYMIRTADDTELVTSGWITLAVQTLAGYEPPNVGVVGPTCPQGNQNILTHDTVHRTHWDIFKYFYPPVFDNWYADDWIREAYTPSRFTKLTKWVAYHHMGTYPLRYIPTNGHHLPLQAEFEKGRKVLREYLESRNSSDNKRRRF